MGVTVSVLASGSRGNSAGGSRFDTWFAMKMHDVFGGTFSSPVVSTRIRANRSPSRTIASDAL